MWIIWVAQFHVNCVLRDHPVWCARQFWRLGSQADGVASTNLENGWKWEVPPVHIHVETCTSHCMQIWGADSFKCWNPYHFQVPKLKHRHHGQKRKPHPCLVTHAHGREKVWNIFKQKKENPATRVAKLQKATLGPIMYLFRIFTARAKMWSSCLTMNVDYIWRL